MANQNFKISKHAKHIGIVKEKEGYIIVMGKFAISEKKFKTLSDAEAYIATKPYEILVNQTLILMRYEKEQVSKVVEENTKENV